MQRRIVARSVRFALVVLLAMPLAAQETAKPQDPKPVEQVDPEVARIGKLIEQANEQVKAKAHEEARASVREALAACLALPGLDDRAEAHDLLWRLGHAAYVAQEQRTAHDAWERVCDYRARTLPDDHPELQRVRMNLAITKNQLGDLPGALALEEKVYEVHSRTLPDDHLDLQRARLNLGVTKHKLGDLAGAAELYEKACATLSRTLPDDHPDLQSARGNLAITKKQLGDLPGALVVFEQAYKVLSRTLPDDHPSLQRARTQLGSTKAELGDLASARELFETVYDLSYRKLPDDHPDLQWARLNLATAKHGLGDLAGARELLEKVLEIRSRTLPDDHPDLQRARQSVALTRRELGDLAGARELDEKVYEILSRKLPDGHPDLQLARGNLAATRQMLGDMSGARELVEALFAVWSRALPDDHPDLQWARLSLALTKEMLGDLAGALELQEKTYSIFSRFLPDDHFDLQRSRGMLAWTHARLGNVDRAVSLIAESSNAARQRLSSLALSPRELGAMAAQASEVLGLLLTFAEGSGKMEAQPQVVGDALAVSQALRGVQTRAARANRRARSVDPERVARLESDLRVAAAEVSRAAGAKVEDGEGLEARRRARDEQLGNAVREKERIERELSALAAKAGHVATGSLSVAELAAALPERSAAAAVVAYTHSRPDPEHEGRAITEARLAALVLDRTAQIRFVPLGPVAGVQPAVETLHGAVQPQAVRGRPAEASAPNDSGLAAARERLREVLMVPMLSACGPVDTLYVAVDELLELVPVDALPFSAEHLVGERIAIRPLVSLFDLLEPQETSVGEAPGLLVAGGLDYGRATGGVAISLDPTAAAAVVERSGGGDTWTPLPGTAGEADGIAAVFAEAFADGTSNHLRDERAGKRQVAAAAPSATFVHLATHGYFAAESVRSTADATKKGDAFGEGVITGLSPLVLCGLALSGANLPPDDLGRHAGILTAEEMLSLDLSHCYLVTLSACDTSLGVRRAGQGYASLRAALQGAGARYVLTSLWKVGDEATMQLMVDFYRRLWVEKKEGHVALWEAKMAAREKGTAFRDWAGWVLTGR